MTDTGTEYRPHNIAEKELQTPEGSVVELAQRISDLEDVVRHMIQAITAFSNSYANPPNAQPKNTAPQKQPKNCYFVAIPTASGLYLVSYSGTQAQTSTRPVYDNAIIVKYAAEQLISVFYASAGLWVPVPPELQNSTPVTEALLMRINHLVKQHEST